MKIALNIILNNFGLKLYYIIEQETNVGINCLDRINSHGWWKENEYTRVYDSKDKANKVADKFRKSIGKRTIGCHQVIIKDIRVIPRIGRIDNDENGEGLFPFRDRFIKSDRFPLLLKNIK